MGVSGSNSEDARRTGKVSPSRASFFHEGIKDPNREGLATMKRLLMGAALPLAIAGVVAGCGSSSKSSTSSSGANASAPASSGGGAYGAPASSTPSSPSTGSGVTIAARSTSLGAILTGAGGRTVYLFEADKGGKSSCNGACAQNWPPVAAGAPGTGIKASLLTTTTRSDGSKQAVYNGHPIYYFSGDTQPTDTKGQGLHAFGADWYEIGPTGSKVEKPGS